MIEKLISTQEHNDKLSLMVANSAIMLFNLRIKNSHNVATEWASNNIQRILGYRESEIYQPDWWFSHIHPQDKSRIISQSQHLIDGKHSQYTFEYRFKHKNGSYIWVHDEQKPEFDEQGQLSNIICLWKDITDKKMLEMELTLAAYAFESHDGIMITDASKRIIKVNHTFEKITGYKATDILGKTPEILKSGKQDAEYYRDMWQSINTQGHWQGEIWNKKQSGEIYPEQLTITAIKDCNEIITNYIAIFNDITERKLQERETKMAAYHDALTNLPNRRLLLDRLARVILTNNRSQKHAALIFLDMDRFKELNDNFGHDTGDRFLQQIASRLEACVRETDTLSRFGGDEFVILLTELSHEPDQALVEAKNLADKIRTRLAEPYHFEILEGGKQQLVHHSSASLGLVVFSDHRDNPETLLKQADLAMYEAKSQGGNKIRSHHLLTTTLP